MKIYRIQEIHGNLYYIVSEDFQEQKIAVLRGKMRILQSEHPSGIPYRNPCCVGDYVKVREPDTAELEREEYPLIDEVLERKNILLRASPHEIHPLGANIDYAVLIMSLKQPEIRTGFIDRFLIACHVSLIEPVIFFTKCDLLTEEDEEILKISKYYKKIAAHVFWDNLLSPGNRGNVTDPELLSFREFREMFSEGTLLLVGQSGTGKSTFTNLIFGKPVQRTNQTSHATGKGRHTTTTSTLLPVNSRLVLIDTPGIKEWGLAHLTKKEIYETYAEWRHLVGTCKFRNCEHSPSTDGCKIQEAILKGVLPEWRRENLEHILYSLDYYERIRPGDYKKPTGRFHNKLFR